ncbi:hypothetical protein B6U99_05875 [Candidatus Geothermarchaeota archaeon ex4572_27]|nr:MAG: hypothetical protein B6U99_05875 [Candidatus Geothermarchaeota archaeon ex4572_27]
MVGGLKLRWGDPELIARLVRMTAYREGLGSLLAEGTARMARLVGGEAERLAPHVKGLELPAYDPRGAKGMALAYATSNRGGCHLRAYVVMSELFSIPRYVDPGSYEGLPPEGLRGHVGAVQHTPIRGPGEL